MNEWKGKTVPHKSPYWRLVLLFIVFLFLEALIVCIVGPAMLKKENPMCCPEFDQRVKSWHDIWR